MSNELNRRNFLKKSAIAAAGIGAVARSSFSAPISAKEPIYKISLAQWSLNASLFGKKMDNLDFAQVARKLDIDAVEYVNQFFKDKAKDMAYLKEMNARAKGEGVTNVLIMCDGEGPLGSPDEKIRLETVDNHKKWVDAAKFLGCHSIRVNGFVSGGWGSAPGDPEEEKKLVADGLRRLCEYADNQGINVIIENHGGNSSNAKWLAGVMKLADHPRAGTLPDFGNFTIYKDNTYDSYRGVDELMPYAKGVSVKPTVNDDDGGTHPLDYTRMMKIVLAHGYHGYCGIEHGRKGSEMEDIARVRDELLKTRDLLTDNM